MKCILFSKGIWETFIAAPNRVITLCAADTIFTYLQDRFPMTHYIFVIGDNDSGKTAFIDVMGATCSRPYSAVSMSDAVLYRVLGSEDEGQAVILLDEANSLSEKILESLKSGYKKSGFVARVDDTVDNKKQPQRFKTYGFKMLAAEYSPTGKGVKGADERFFKIKTKRALQQLAILPIQDGEQHL
jgi:Signal recognition particle receptor beta subunit